MSKFKKQAWPWIGTDNQEMGSMMTSEEPKTSYKMMNMESTTPDGLAPEKSSVQLEETTGYANSIVSPVDGIDQEVSLSLDSKSQINLEVKKDDDSPLASFCCDIAKTMQEKVVGLQSYTDLNETAGLLFKYSKPEDVIYHMGTVTFPIDILFIDSENKIKKIYKNIKPGTLATFGCANVKSVLEICGGLTERLGINEGYKINISNEEPEVITKINSVSKNLSIQKKSILKYSSIESNKISNWKGFPVVTINDNSFTKTASEVYSSLTSTLVELFPPKEIIIQAFDFDDLIRKDCKIKIFKTTTNYNSGFPALDINNKVAFINIHNENYCNEIALDKLLIAPLLSADEAILLGSNKSLENVFSKYSDFEEAMSLFENLIKAAKNNQIKPVIITRYPNPYLIKKIICGKLGMFYGTDIAHNVEALNVLSNSDHYDVISQIKLKYKTANIELFASNNITKKAGVPVPDNIKESAKKAYKILESVSDVIEISLENFQNNLQEYEKIRDNLEAVKNSKGQYNQSIKSNTRIIKDYLIKIRDVVKILNNIKDASTTIKIIDSLADSAKTASDSVEEIFNLIEQLDSPNFFNSLSEATTKYEKSIEDLESSVDKAKSYINSEILGLLIISD